MTRSKKHKDFDNFDRYYNQRHCRGIETVYFHYDGLGSVSALSNERGCQIAAYKYEAFGNVYSEVKGITDYRFSTKEHDSTGLIYFGARYYNPQIGRWITKDPMGMIDGPNMYNYVRSNPVNFIDEWGNLSLTPTWVSSIAGTTGTPMPIWQPTPVNPNGTSKQEAKPKQTAESKEEAINPTADYSKGKNNDEEKKGKIENNKKNPVEKFIDKLKRIKSKTFRKRYTDGTYIYEEDGLHKNELEKYNQQGKHQGSVNAETGETIKPSKGYRIDV